MGTASPQALNTQKVLVTEEYEEFLEAHKDFSKHPDEAGLKEDLLKEIADLVFVCFQYAATAGMELDEALDRVYRSNMSKMVDGKPLKREDGKVLKGPFYKPPYLKDLV